MRRKTHFFGDEITSRRHFWAGNSIFWRRNSFSSSFLGWKCYFLASKLLLIVFLGPETPLFGDETLSCRHFEAENSLFWRRDHFSSSLLGGKLHFLATILVLVVIFRLEMLFFGDEITSRRHFWPGNSIFWRRNPFSSSFWGRKLHFLATKLVLVVIFVRKSPFFGDETLSRRHFGAGNAFFWRRNSFSSSFLCGNLHFLATRLILVVVFGRKTHFFGDDTLSRRRFWTENSLFWRRDPFSSPFWDRKRYFLATTLILVAFFAPEPPLFGDETFSSSFLCVNKYTNSRFSAFDCL
ncbi:hypothetical protein BT1A1_3056 [Caldibacillus thermoamylovorans]|uniref:Uncharacterized protein n=1 Tax=Caldibacillus thermoamylovorans TaxID=35841 RepID=A0A090J2H3_9BACI|nr:hypothetical protein BT1A1_3056 [Caldibacillus thermoamylovorans]